MERTVRLFGPSLAIAVLLVFAPTVAGTRGLPLPTASAHSPILIEGDGNFTAANGVTGGSGTNATPFIMSGWSIQANSGGIGIEIRNTTAPFVIQGIDVGAATGQNGLIGILLHNVTDAGIDRVHVSNVFVALREEGSSRLIVSNSTFDVGESFNSGVAVVLFGPPNLPSQDLLIVDSTIRAGLDGINTQNVSRLTIERCAFFVPYVDAINLWTDEDVTVRANQFVIETTGVSVVDSTRVRMEDNRIRGGNHTASVGIYVEASSDVVLVRNEIQNMYRAGISFSTDSRFPGQFNPGFRAYHNTFLAGGSQIDFAPTDSIWDDGYPSGGNYWANYGGSDQCRGPAQDDCSNRDGIGDTAHVWYTQLTTVADRYPLVRPFPLPTSSPIARIAVTATVGEIDTSFVFNASMSSDLRDPVSLLQFRWDWEGDGSWDTNWSSDPVRPHVFGVSGAHGVRLQVRNTAGLMNATTVDVHVSSPSFSRILGSVWPIFPVVAGVTLLGIGLHRWSRKPPPALPQGKTEEPPPGSAP